MTAPALVRPVTCRRCKGTGTVSTRVRRAHLGVPGLCFDCNGDGVVEGDRATLDAARAQAAAAQEVLRRNGQAQQALLDAGDRDAYRGLLALGEREPARLSAAVDAVLAGHPTVAHHLATYFVATLTS